MNYDFLLRQYRLHNENAVVCNFYIATMRCLHFMQNLAAAQDEITECHLSTAVQKTFKPIYDCTDNFTELTVKTNYNVTHQIPLPLFLYLPALIIITSLWAK